LNKLKGESGGFRNIEAKSDLFRDFLEPYSVSSYIDKQKGTSPKTQGVMMNIKKVWIDESENECTMCGACEAICDTVFEVPEKVVVLKNADLSQKIEIIEAVECCPVEVIKFTQE
jgi:ferredoxin